MSAARKPICKNPTVPTEVGMGVLSRSEFTISRLAEFASKEELARLIGHGPEDWPVAALKEILDNSLDSSERAGVAPVVAIVVDEDSISVADNGSGLVPATVERILDYAYRTSSNAAYVSPTRGQQGNAIQCLVAMSHALSGEPGVTIIESLGVRHRITFSVDPVSREPRLDHQRSAIPAAPETKVTMFWPSLLPRVGLHNTAVDFFCVNPHLTLSFASEDLSFGRPATNPRWTKWTPADPTPAHWYDAGSLKTLIAAEIDKARKTGSPQRTVADFIAQFRGLSGTAKRRDLCETVGASRQRLDVFFDAGDFAIRRLLAAMQSAGRPVKPSDLGVIGETHLFSCIAGVSSSRRYKRIEVDVDGVPYLVECAFRFLPEGS